MASRRMYSKDFILTDTFIELEHSAKVLYFYLMANADDDGFFENARTITRLCDTTANDLNALIDNGFIIKFDSGVYVITHWKVHNLIRNDRYTKTIHQSEFNQLSIDQANKYVLMDTNGKPNGYQTDTNGIPTVSVGKDSVGKDSTIKDNISKVNLEKTNISEFNQAREKESVREKTNDKNGNEQNSNLADNEFREFFSNKNYS